MSTYLLTLIPAMFGVFCIVGATTLNEEHGVLKIFLFLVSLVSVLASLWLGVVIQFTI